MTEYKPVPSRPGYLAGRDGSIIGKRGRVLKQAAGTSGYRIFRFSQPGHAPVTASSHVAICEAWHGPKPTPAHEVAHGNGDRTDNRAENLAWKTRPENHADKIRHGTNLRGDRHPSSKITDEDVLAIRASTERPVDLALRYGVTAVHISNIKNGRRRIHVVPPVENEATSESKERV